MKTPDPTEGQSASELVDKQIAELGDWRGETLSRMRQLIREADPDVIEGLKWIKPTSPGGTPTWSHDGIICTGETYKSVVKLTFARGLPSMTPPGSSTRVSMATRGAQLTSARARRSTRARSRRSSMPRSPSMHPAERLADGLPGTKPS